MFNDVNKVMLLGNITNDPDLKFTPGGSPVLNFGMATNRRYKKGEEWVDDTTFHNIVIWGQQAQNLSLRIKKGTRLYLEGRLQVRTWDGTDGKKQYKTEVVVDEVSLVSRYNEGSNAELGGMPTAPTGGGIPAGMMKTGADLAANSPASMPDVDVDTSIDPDDLPF